jgi:hypothetical protein
MYDAGRYFTITGNHLDVTPTTIEESSRREAPRADGDKKGTVGVVFTPERKRNDQNC